jgi:phosphate transport system protein
MIRKHFSDALTAVNDEILKMGVMVEEALRDAVTSLKNQDTRKAQLVIDRDEAVNAKEMALFDRVTTLLATEQPVAGDLRHLIGAVRIVTDLERAGDYAVHIAEGTLHLQGEVYLKPLTVIPAMGEIAVEMLQKAIKAFLDEDTEAAIETAALDRKMDELYSQIFEVLLPHMRENPADVKQSTELLFLARYLERMGDHVVNICEWIVYCQSGKHVEL